MPVFRVNSFPDQCYSWPMIIRNSGRIYSTVFSARVFIAHDIQVKLLDFHFEGIIVHATYKLSSGKIEGINQKIKTLRRHGYGYPDDEYFFMKIMDMSRKAYVRNQPSHKICD